MFDNNIVPNQLFHEMYEITYINVFEGLTQVVWQCKEVFLRILMLKKKGVPSAVGFPHCAGSGEGLSLSPKPYPHKCAEAGARTRDLPVTDGRLYR